MISPRSHCRGVTAGKRADVQRIVRCPGPWPIRRSSCNQTACGRRVRRFMQTYLRGAGQIMRVGSWGRFRPPDAVQENRPAGEERMPASRRTAPGGAAPASAPDPRPAPHRRRDRLRAPSGAQSSPRMSCCRRVMYAFIASSASLGFRRRIASATPRVISSWERAMACQPPIFLEMKNHSRRW